MEYPLRLTFKFFTLAPQVPVTDAAGRLVCCVRQEPFKLKEAVQIFSDREQTKLLCRVDADRILDFTASYTIAGPGGEKLGVLNRSGMASLWKAHYEFSDPEGPAYTIREENPWAKVFDGLLGMVPLAGLLSGYFFHPAYTLKDKDGGLVLRLEKKAAFLEGRFEITGHAELEPAQEARLLYAFLMLLLLERTRG
jgi:uncharacterized protein YxjI